MLKAIPVSMYKGTYADRVIPKTAHMLSLIFSILFCLLTLQAAFGWTNNMTFESYSVGQTGSGNCNGAGDGICDSSNYQSVVSSPVHGGSRALRLQIIGGTTAQMQFGFRLNNNVYAGGEIWARYYFYPEQGWDWTSNPATKTIRFHIRNGNNAHAGYATIYSMMPGNASCSASPSNNSYFIIDNETMGPLWMCQNQGSPYQYLTPGEWHSIEIYMKLSSTGTGITRVWHNGTLMIEYLNQSNIPSGGYLHKGDAATHVPHFFGYWNGGASKNQYAYVDDFRITTDRPSNVDAQGNPMIGPTDWAAPTGEAPPVISNPLPSGAQSCSSNPTSVTLKITTDESARCKYGTSDVTYDSLPNTFSATDSTSHSQTVSGLTCGSAYTYYVRCMDNSNNQNTASTPISFTVATGVGANRTIFFAESFDDDSFAARAWFDDNSVPRSTTTQQHGTSSLQLTWTKGATNPNNVGLMRKTFTPSDKIYVKYYWRFNSDWIGSGVAYHPHMISLLSDLDDPWVGPSLTYLNNYIEVNNLTPRILIQDTMNIVSNPTPQWSTTRGTETRSVGGCNGCLPGSDCGNIDCYACSSNSGWCNYRGWDGTSNFLLNTWHKVEAYFQMNTISGGIGQPNGIMWMKVDNNYVINKTNIVYRTNQHPTMKWKTFIIAPYIGDGSPQAQTMWMDELEVADAPPSLDPPPNFKTVNP
jgi:hypothetical protein